MGLSTSVCNADDHGVDHVDAETFPLKLLLNEVVVKTPSQVQQTQQTAWDEEEKEQLRRKNHQLRHEKNYWRDYARELEKERNELSESSFFSSLYISSPLTKCSEKIYRPDIYSHDKKWYKTNCPCCRRPLEISVTSLKEPWTSKAWTKRYCFATALWGANAGYALGALVLGQRLKELSPNIERVMLHTDDVPSNYLEAFEKDGLWQLRRVDYIDGVADLYVSKGNIFDGVFTKLQAWTLEDFAKVLLLDLDIIPLKPLDDLFNLRCPAAMVRGQGENTHGEEVDGSRFFGGEDNKDYPWGQQGGINAGLILLQPEVGIFEQMKSEVTCKCHPCHVAGNGPEQDYLSRFFAARRESPWHQISVAWNYQLHQSLFAIERVLQWKVFMDNSKTTRDFSQADNEWLPQRLRMGVEDIGVVHFSGEVKMWHRFLTAIPPSDDRRREVHHAVAQSAAETSDEAFAQYLLSIQRGHSLWVSKTAEPEEYQEHGCRREGQQIFVGEQDVTAALEWMVQRVVQVAVVSTQVWRQCYERLQPNLEELLKPKVPEGCFDLNTRVEVSWTMGQGSRKTVRWLPAQVLAVHENKDYVVRFQRGGDWGDTERHVHPSRVRLPEVNPSATVDGTDGTVHAAGNAEVGKE